MTVTKAFHRAAVTPDFRTALLRSVESTKKGQRFISILLRIFTKVDVANANPDWERESLTKSGIPYP